LFKREDLLTLFERVDGIHRGGLVLPRAHNRLMIIQRLGGNSVLL